MVNAINNSTATQATTPAGKTSQSSNSSSTASITAGADKVQLSNTAQAILKEATETAATTAKEAAGGDIQAQKLLLKEEQKASIQK